MVSISTLEFTEDLASKLKSQGVDTLSSTEANVVNSIKEGGNILMKNGADNIFLKSCAVSKAEAIKKMKDQRLARILVCTNQSDNADKIAEDIKSLVTKDLSIVLCTENIKVKKNKKNFDKAVDIVVGTLSRIVELIDSEVLNTSNLKQVYCFADLDESEVAISQLLKNIDEGVQKILTCSEISPSSDIILKKFKGTFQKFESSDEESESDSAEESEEEPIKVNQDAPKPIDSSDDDKDQTESPVEEKKEEATAYDIDQTIIDTVGKVADFDKHTNTAKLLIEKYNDVELVSRLIAMNRPRPQKQKNTMKFTKPASTGEASKYTSRPGFTAYHFRTNRPVLSNGYLYKGLKRQIAEELVENISHVRKEKDEMGFVFDLPSEKDDEFQSTWRDGKFDTLCLLEGDVPELAELSNQNGGGRGGRGGNRNSRGGYKRPGEDSFGNNSKVQRF